MSEINVNFTINQFNANLTVDPAPEVTLNVQDPMTANFYIEGTSGGPAAPVNGVQLNGGNGFLAASNNFTYQANANIGWPSLLTGNIVSVGNIVVGELYSGYEGITIKTPANSTSVNNLNIEGSLIANRSGGDIRIKAADALGTGLANGNGGVLYLFCGSNDFGSGAQGEVIIGGETNSNVRFINTGVGFTFSRLGEFLVGGSSGEAGHVLTSQGAGTNPQWQNMGPANLTNVTTAFEAITLHTTTSGTYNFDIALSNAIAYSTANATANITLNFRGSNASTLNNLLNVGQSVTAVYLMTTGSTGYIPSTIQIDGVTRTVRYAGNAAPTAIANTVCSYTYTMIKTSSTPTWVVLGSQTRYG
jgi:hypothetical protein